MSRREIEVKIRNGRSTAAYPIHNGVSMKVAVVSDGFLWLGASREQGIAWISGKETLRDLRDALTEMINGNLPTSEKESDGT
jgi:hypothetical protein